MWRLSRSDERQISAVLIKHDSNLLLHRLQECLSWSVSESATPPTPFPHCQPPHPSLFLTSGASNSSADLNRSVPFIVESKGIFHVSKRTGCDSCTRTRTHSVSPEQMALHHFRQSPAAAATRMKLCVNGYEVLSGSRGEQPLMILSWSRPPSRAVWRTLSPFWLTRLFWMCFRCLLNTQKRCQNTTNESSNNANPLNVWSFLIFWGLIQNSLLYQTKIWKKINKYNNVGLLVNVCRNENDVRKLLVLLSTKAALKEHDVVTPTQGISLTLADLSVYMYKNPCKWSVFLVTGEINHTDVWWLQLWETKQSKTLDKLGRDKR